MEGVSVVQLVFVFVSVECVSLPVLRDVLELGYEFLVPYKSFRSVDSHGSH